MRRLVTLTILVVLMGAAAGAPPPTETSASNGGKIYWTDSIFGAISRANLDGSRQEDLLTGLSYPQGIALDASRGKMYWTESGKIRRADLDGSGPEDLLTLPENPRSIALDLSGGKMYWTSHNKVERANMDGSGLEELVTGLPDAGDIALDVDGGKMYWTGPDRINRANLDGSGQEGADVPTVAGIALDLEAGKIYWTDFQGTVPTPFRISRANLDASGFEVILERGGWPYPQGGSIALDVSGGKMYWAAGVDFMPQPRGISRANLDGSEPETILGFSATLDGRSPARIALYFPSTVAQTPTPGQPATATTASPPAPTATAGLVAPDTGACCTAEATPGPLFWAFLAATLGLGGGALASAAWYARKRLTA